MEEKEEGITLGQLFSVMFGRKILLLIITLVIFIVGTLCFKFLYNDNQEYYYSNFSYNSEDLMEGTYIDNSKFNINDLISESNLKSIKASNDEFSSIDIDKLLENNAISITKVITYVTINDEETTEIDNIKLNITVKAKYFDSDTQAKHFVSSIASYPVSKTLTDLETISYTSYLDLFDSATSYESQINYLELQLDLLKTKYNNLLEEYGNIILSDNMTLDAKLQEVEDYFNTYDLSLLYSEVNLNGYIKDDSYKSQLKINKDSLINSYTNNLNKISELVTQRDNLIASTSSGSSLQTVEISEYNSQIISLTTTNINTLNSIKYINYKLGLKANAGIESYCTDESVASASDKTEFETRLQTYKTKLASFTTTYSTVEKEVIEKYLTIYYDSTNVIEQDGGISVFIYALLFLVVGLVVGCVVNLCLDYKKLSIDYKPIDKKELTEEPKEEN